MNNIESNTDFDSSNKIYNINNNNNNSNNFVNTEELVIEKIGILTLVIVKII